MRVWTDTVRSQVFSVISFNFVDTQPSLVEEEVVVEEEEDFLLNAFDISLVENR